MAKKDEVQGVQCENADIEILRRQLARLENTLTEKFTEVKKQIGSIRRNSLCFPTGGATATGADRGQFA